MIIFENISRQKLTFYVRNEINTPDQGFLNANDNILKPWLIKRIYKECHIM